MKTLFSTYLVAIAVFMTVCGQAQTYSNKEIPFDQADAQGQLRKKRLPQNANDYRAQLGKYAVFWIPMPEGARFTDFELKASVDNFATENMVFFYHSPDPNKNTFPYHIWTVKPDVYYTSSGRAGMSPNQRTWLKQGSTSIFAQLEDGNAAVGGFIIIVRDDLTQYRNNLVWSYSLMDASTTDNDPVGRSVWRPIWPVDWINSFNANP